MPVNPKILLVDDEAPITTNLAPFLERTGFQVFVAGDGEQALQEIAENLPDLVVMDVLMPRLDGREVLRRLRREGNWIPIILLTQVGESVERAMALEEGADDYLNKPFDPHALAGFWGDDRVVVHHEGNRLDGDARQGGYFFHGGFGVGAARHKQGRQSLYRSLER